jgi:hypothetical protein
MCVDMPPPIQRTGRMKRAMKTRIFSRAPAVTEGRMRKKTANTMVRTMTAIRIPVGQT